MLLHEQCKPVTLDQESAFLSKGGYVVDGVLWWTLDYIFDNFRANGESRALWKWMQMFKKAVESTNLCDVQTTVHLRSSTLPEEALKANVAQTVAILAFFLFILRESRTAALVQLVGRCLPQLCYNACQSLVSPGNVEVPVENMLRLTISGAGAVRGVLTALQARHQTCAKAWQNEWLHMMQAGELTEHIGAEAVPLTDLVRFLLSVDKRRKSKGSHPWTPDSIAGSSLRLIQRAIIGFLHVSYDSSVRRYIAEHASDVDRVAPSRQARQVQADASSSGAVCGQVVQRRRSRSHMSPDAIYELLQLARETGGASMKIALRLFKDKRLSNVAGCDSNAADVWGRRLQNLYDSRCGTALAGATHLNIIADCSTHAGKELLVSICWSHQNGTACFANNQVILPGNQVAPGEMELSSLVEVLAKENKLVRLASYRQLQAISQQIHLLTNGKYGLDSFREAPGVSLSPVRPGCKRFIDESHDGHRLRAGHLNVGTGDSIYLMPEGRWWEDQPLLTLQLDQGPTGTAGLAYAISAEQSLVSVRWDPLHRAVRDYKLSLLHGSSGEYLQSQMHSQYLWSLAYRPFGSGTFMEDKKRALELMIARESSDLSIFRELWEQIRDEAGMASTSTPEEVWRMLPSLPGFSAKQTLPKLSRWFSWNAAAEEGLSEWASIKCVLGYYFQDLSLDPDEAYEVRRLELLAKEDSEKKSLRAQFSDLKQKLGGGLKLSYYLMSTRLWVQCRIISLCTRPLWSWYTSTVEQVKNCSDNVANLIYLSGAWQRDEHLRDTAALPTSQLHEVVSLLGASKFDDTPFQICELSQHLLKHRAWSLSKCAGPPDCYAGLLSSSLADKQAP